MQNEIKPSLRGLGEVTQFVSLGSQSKEKGSSALRTNFTAWLVFWISCERMMKKLLLDSKTISLFLNFYPQLLE